MKILIDKKSSCEILSKLSCVSLGKAVQNILNYALFETIGDKLVKVTVTNVDSCASAEIKAEVIETGKCLIELKKLLAVLNTLNKTAVIEDRGSEILITEDKSSAVLNTIELAQNEFSLELFAPIVSKGGVKLNISGGALKDALKRSVLFALHDEKMPNAILRGVNIVKSGQMIEFKAADGAALAMCINACENNEDNFNIIISQTTANNLMNLINDDDIEITVNEKVINIDYGAGNYTSRLVEGNYPKFEQFFDKERPVRVIFQTAQLLKFIERVKVLASKDNYAVDFNINGVLCEVSANNSKVLDVLPVEHIGEDISITLNRVYLDNLLKVADKEELEFKLSSPMEGVAIDVREHKYLIMPIKKGCK